jgi:hypothetical protein
MFWRHVHTPCLVKIHLFLHLICRCIHNEKLKNCPVSIVTLGEPLDCYREFLMEEFSSNLLAHSSGGY